MRKIVSIIGFIGFVALLPFIMLMMIFDKEEEEGWELASNQIKECGKKI